MNLSKSIQFLPSSNFFTPLESSLTPLTSGYPITLPGQSRINAGVPINYIEPSNYISEKTENSEYISSYQSLKHYTISPVTAETTQTRHKSEIPPLHQELYEIDPSDDYLMQLKNTREILFDSDSDDITTPMPALSSADVTHNQNFHTLSTDEESDESAQYLSSIGSAPEAGELKPCSPHQTLSGAVEKQQQFSGTELDETAVYVPEKTKPCLNHQITGTERIRKQIKPIKPKSKRRRNKEKINAHAKQQRRQNDPEYRERVNRQNRENMAKRMENPDYRDKWNAARRKKRQEKKEKSELRGQDNRQRSKITLKGMEKEFLARDKLKKEARDLRKSLRNMKTGAEEYIAASKALDTIKEQQIKLRSVFRNAFQRQRRIEEPGFKEWKNAQTKKSRKALGDKYKERDNHAGGRGEKKNPDIGRGKTHAVGRGREEKNNLNTEAN